MSQQNPEGRSRMKREALDSFTTFYLPKYGQKAEARFKRDLLKTFSTFYLPASAKEGKYERYSQVVSILLTIMHSKSHFLGPGIRIS